MVVVLKKRVEMTPMSWALATIEAGIWYVFLYCFLYSIKHKVNLFASAFVLLVLIYIAAFCCPLIRHSDSWHRMWNMRMMS